MGHEPLSDWDFHTVGMGNVVANDSAMVPKMVYVIPTTTNDSNRMTAAEYQSGSRVGPDFYCLKVFRCIMLSLPACWGNPPPRRCSYPPPRLRSSDDRHVQLLNFFSLFLSSS